MKLSISNIAWTEENDEEMYSFLKQEQLDAIEIAPTRIFPSEPYQHTKEAAAWANELKQQYGLSVSSMQSIWYGRTENLFHSPEERQRLSDYTRRAIDFAQAISCPNLVFGCPRNRTLDEGADSSIAVDFFKELGEYARRHNTVLALEPNPVIYHTNYMNTTAEALRLIEEVASPGFLLNLDIGTMLYNNETIDILRRKPEWIHHVHISEPGLGRIESHELHQQLAAFLHTGYEHYVSIEMGRQDSLQDIRHTIHYLKGLFA